MVCDVPYVNRRDGKIIAPFPQELIALWKLRNKKYAADCSAAYFLCGRLLGGAVEEGNDLRTQAVAVRGEGGVARAGGHARVDGPLHGGGVEGARAHIGKGVRALSRRLSTGR